MRRLTVVQLLPALNGGGVERSTLEIGRALVAAGHRSLVVSAGGRLVARLVEDGSEHLCLDIGGKSLRTLARVPALRRSLAALSPDIVHARSRLPAWLARACLPASARFVTTVHGLNSPGRYSRVMACGERVICVSETVRTHVLRNWPGTDPGRLVVIPRGIDPAEFPRREASTPGWREGIEATHPELRGGRWLLLPGRGTRLKGHAEALRLLAALRATGLDLRLWLLGASEPGRERYLEEMATLAQSLGVAGCWVASVPRDDIVEAYAASELVLQLSTQPEAFGRTVLEALSVGRPVLGFDHGGVGELLASHYPAGRVPVGDAGALQARALALLSQAPPPPSMIAHTLADMQSRTLELYDDLVARPRARA